MVLLLVILLGSVIAVLCMFAFFREDKEEKITPLCPQLVVRDTKLKFWLPNDTAGLNNFQITDENDRCVCKVAMDWPDPLRPGSGVAATMRLQTSHDSTLATVVARNVHVVGQGLALCRSGCEIFGFVVPDGPRRYHLRHRTGVHLLTLAGDFADTDVLGLNPVNSKVCWFKSVGDRCTGGVLQHVDAGLVICGLLATRVHRRLTLAAGQNMSPRTSAISMGKFFGSSSYWPPKPTQTTGAKEGSDENAEEKTAVQPVQFSPPPGVRSTLNEEDGKDTEDTSESSEEQPAVVQTEAVQAAQIDIEPSAAIEEIVTTATAKAPDADLRHV